MAGAVVAFVVLALALAGLLNRVLSQGVLLRWLNPIAYAHEVSSAAAEYELDPHLVLAVVKAESGFKPTARSSAGARGLMQIMPETATWIVSRVDWSGPKEPDLEDPEQNLALGCYYLRFLSDRYQGNEIALLAAYNAGHGVVDSWLGNYQSESLKLTVESIPYSDTRDFVRRVLYYQKLYGRLYPDL